MYPCHSVQYLGLLTSEYNPLSEYTGPQDNVKNVHLGVPIGTIVGQDGIVYIHASYMPSCPTSAYKYPQMNILDINCPGGQYMFTVYMIFKSIWMTAWMRLL